MALLRLKPFAAPKRYVFKDPDTGFNYEERTQKELIQRIVAYRAQNQLAPLERLDLVLPNYWCSLAENRGECEVCPPLGKIDRGLWQYIKGGVALVETLTYPKEHLVSIPDADKRAAICVNCKYNVFPDKDAFVRWSDEVAAAVLSKVLKDKRSKYHDLLGNCEVCSCTLKYKVFYKGSMGLNEDQKRKMQEVGCWQPKADEDAKEDTKRDKIRREIESRRGKGS